MSRPTPRLLAVATALAALSLAACRHKRPKSAADEDFDAYKDPQFAALARRYENSVVMPNCGEVPSGPSVQRWTRGTISGKQACGLLANDFNEPREGSVLAERCASEPSDCTQLVRAAFRARLTERYSLADQAWIANHCAGYPDECSRLDLLELLWLKSHNETAAYGFEQSVRRMEEERAIAREERRDRRWRRAFLGIAAGALIRSSRRGD